MGLSSRHFTSASIRLPDDLTSPAEKISRTQNKDKITLFQKLQTLFFINKKSKKTNEVGSHWSCKGQTLSYIFPEIKIVNPHNQKRAKTRMKNREVKSTNKNKEIKSYTYLTL